MEANDEHLITSWREALTHDLSLICRVSDDERSAGFISFCEGLTRVAPAVHVTRKTLDDEAGLPGIEVSEHLVYHAVPQGPELPPFLDLLSLLDSGKPRLSEEIMPGLDQLKTPCMLKLFITPQCPFCPKSVKDFTPLPLVNPWVHLKVIDGTLFPEMAAALSIQSAPTLVYDDRMRWTGYVRPQEVLAVTLNQDPSLMSAATMEGILAEGKAGFLAEMMIAEGNLFPALFDLLTHDKWPVRLGAMVVVEEICETDPDLASRCVEPLWQRFPDLDEAVQGDVVYILGQAGDQNTLPRLERILSGPYGDEIREAAREAVDAIKERKMG